MSISGFLFCCGMFLIPFPWITDPLDLSNTGNDLGDLSSSTSPGGGRHSVATVAMASSVLSSRYVVLIPRTRSFAWISGFLAAWNLGVLYLLQLCLEGRDPSSHRLTSPRFINTLAITTVTVFIGFMITCIAITQKPIGAFQKAAQFIKETLLDAAAEEVPDLEVVATSLAPAIYELPAITATYIHSWSIVMWVLAAWNMLLLIASRLFHRLRTSLILRSTGPRRNRLLPVLRTTASCTRALGSERDEPSRDVRSPFPSSTTRPNPR